MWSIFKNQLLDYGGTVLILLFMNNNKIHFITEKQTEMILVFIQYNTL